MLIKKMNLQLFAEDPSPADSNPSAEPSKTSSGASPSAEPKSFPHTQGLILVSHPSLGLSRCLSRTRRGDPGQEADAIWISGPSRTGLSIERLLGKEIPGISKTGVEQA